MLKVKLQYFGHLMQRANSLEKNLLLGNIEGRRRWDNRGWDGWMALLAQWTWVWASCGNWWWTGKPGMLQSTVSQIVVHNWTEHGLAYKNKTQFSPWPVPPIRKLAHASYPHPHPSEDRQNGNHNHRKLTNLSHAMQPCLIQFRVRHWWWVLTNMVHWRRGWQTSSAFLPWEPHEQYEKAKNMTLKDEHHPPPTPCRSVDIQYATGEEQRNSSRRNEEAEANWKQ